MSKTFRCHAFDPLFRENESVSLLCQALRGMFPSFFAFLLFALLLHFVALMAGAAPATVDGAADMQSTFGAGSQRRTFYEETTGRQWTQNNEYRFLTPVRQ